MSLIDRRRLLLAVPATLAFPAEAAAGRVLVAVAANFAEPARLIGQRFTARFGHKVAFSVGSSGAFAAQIRQGAPFDVFLCADSARITALDAEGLTRRGSRFTYATGRLALWSPLRGLVDPAGEVLRADTFRKLAIADPASAPYGQAAIETLTSLGLLEKLTPRLIKGASISQAFTFVQSGGADLGFVALSQVIGLPAAQRWLVPERLHTPLIQDAVQLTPNSTGAAFLAFLNSPEAKAIIRRFGYEVSA